MLPVLSAGCVNIFVPCAGGLKCFDAVGWVAGRASGL